MFFSIAICTYNNAELLRKTLKSLAGLKCFTRDRYEVLVILNNCSDNSSEVTREFQNSCFPAFRVLHESRQGLSFARNTALREAKGNIVCFLDDDVIVDSGWLQAISEAFTFYRADVVGGRSYLVFSSPQKPDWFMNDYEPLLSKLDHGIEVLENTELELYGLNFCVNKDIVAKVGYFNVNLGRKGRMLLSGEEKDFQQRVIAAGGKCVYMPSACVGHMVPDSRMQKKWFLKRSFFKGYSADAIQSCSSKYQVIYVLMRCSLGLIKSYLLKDCDHARWFNKQMVFAEFAGKAVYLFRSGILAKNW